jgi:hypothetical protein
VDVVPPLIANREPTVLGKPGQCAFHNLPVLPQLLAALLTLPRYPRFDAASAERFAALLGVVGFVSMQLSRTLARATSSRTLDRLYGVHQLLQDRAVVDVSSSENYRERDPVSVRHKVALRARFSLIRRILASFLAPFLAGTLAESREALSQSISSASASRSSNIPSSSCHTPASCQSFKRRQQVEPEPQPISLGSISQGMPLFSTKTMPVRAARSGTRGLPPLGFSGSSGNRGSLVSHSSSETSSLLMLLSVTSDQQKVLQGSLSA